MIKYNINKYYKYFIIMRFHVFGICHTVSDKEYVACAFTQKVVKFCKMMSQISDEDRIKKQKMTPEELVRHKTIHYVIHYGHERSKVDADEHVTVTDDKVLKDTYGDYDWKKDFFKHRAYDHAHMTFTKNTEIELGKRILPGDILLCFWGFGHRDATEKYKHIGLVVEPGIGYPPETSFAQFKVYESYAVMHNHYGIRKVIHPPWYDCVIPNYFDPDEFIYTEKKDNYILYLGRITLTKGLDVVIHLAKTMGFRLLIAGQGDLATMGYNNLPSNIEYVGFADIEKRKKLMANAKALIISTHYIEPFGGVVMEALMSGTPVITCDWGVYNETVLHGLTGYRCRTIDHFEYAIRNIDKIDPKNCRNYAINNYSLDKVRKMYEEYFDMLLKVKFNEGFTLQDPSRTELDWLYKEYPTLSIDRQIQRKPSVLILTETKWAFGRIAHDLQKYSKNLDISILDWNKIPKRSYLEQYDLIYGTSADCTKKIAEMYPEIAHKITFTGHGLIDFVRFDSRPITKEKMENFIIDCDIVEWLQNYPLPFSVVSEELYRLLTTKYNINEDKIYLTKCGVDDKFYPLNTNNHLSTYKLRICYTIPKDQINNQNINSINNDTHYDTKRRYLYEQLKNHPDMKDIEFINPDKQLELNAMNEFYNNADILLILSHTEGNPLGLYEANKAGLAVITTTVGEAPNYIVDGYNGYLISNDNDENIINESIEKIKLLNENRYLLDMIKQNGINKSNERNWENMISEWETFFIKSIANVRENNISQTII